MELKVLVEGLPRVVCGVTETTTCQDVVVALAHALGRTGRYTLVEKWRDTERLLGPAECPLLSLQKWGEYAADVLLILRYGGKQPGNVGTSNVVPPPSPPSSHSLLQRGVQRASLRRNLTFNSAPMPNHRHRSSVKPNNSLESLDDELQHTTSSPITSSSSSSSHASVDARRLISPPPRQPNGRVLRHSAERTDGDQRCMHPQHQRHVVVTSFEQQRHRTASAERRTPDERMCRTEHQRSRSGDQPRLGLHQNPIYQPLPYAADPTRRALTNPSSAANSHLRQQQKHHQQQPQHHQQQPQHHQQQQPHHDHQQSLALLAELPQQKTVRRTSPPSYYPQVSCPPPYRHQRHPNTSNPQHSSSQPHYQPSSQSHYKPSSQSHHPPSSSQSYHPSLSSQSSQPPLSSQSQHPPLSSQSHHPPSSSQSHHPPSSQSYQPSQSYHHTSSNSHHKSSSQPRHQSSSQSRPAPTSQSRHPSQSRSASASEPAQSRRPSSNHQEFPNVCHHSSESNSQHYPEFQGHQHLLPQSHHPPQAAKHSALALSKQPKKPEFYDLNQQTSSQPSNPSVVPNHHQHYHQSSLPSSSNSSMSQSQSSQPRSSRTTPTQSHHQAKEERITLEWLLRDQGLKLEEQALKLKSFDEVITPLEDHSHELDQIDKASLQEEKELEKLHRMLGAELEELEIVSWNDKLQLEQKQNEKFRAELHEEQQKLKDTEAKIKDYSGRLKEIELTVAAGNKEQSKIKERQKNDEIKLLQEMSEIQKKINTSLVSLKEREANIEQLEIQVKNLESGILERRTTLSDYESQLQKQIKDVAAPQAVLSDGIKGHEESESELEKVSEERRNQETSSDWHDCTSKMKGNVHNALWV